MNDGHQPQRVPLPPCNLPRNEVLELINRLAWEQVTFGGNSQDAKPEGSMTTPHLVTGFTSVTFSSTSEPGVAWVVQGIPETTHTKFNGSTLKDYLTWLATIADGLTVVEHLDLDLMESEDSHAPSVT